MVLNYTARTVLAFSLLACGTARADLFDQLNKAVDAAKKMGAPVAAAPGVWTTVPASGNPATTPATSNSDTAAMPFGLEAYPRSKVHKRHYNPFDRVRIPISVPVNTPEGFVSRYSVPMEGKITMVQYIHHSEDSPLQIRQYYEAILAQAGFERLAICEAPCKQEPQNSYWRPAVDPAEVINPAVLPGSPTYIVGYRPDAMVLIGIGRWAETTSSLVKVVEGRVLDPQPWLLVTTPKSVAPPVAPSRPAPAQPTPPAAPVPPGKTPPPPAPAAPVPPTPGQTGSAPAGDAVEMVAPADLPALLAASKGYVVVQLSSYDTSCGYCVQVNPAFDQLAQQTQGKAQFVRAMYQPWRSAWPDDAFVKSYGVTGLPITLTFKNGQLVRRVGGSFKAEELEKKLLQGLR